MEMQLNLVLNQIIHNFFVKMTKIKDLKISRN
jgi:hypothetical protein